MGQNKSFLVDINKTPSKTKPTNKSFLVDLGEAPSKTDKHGWTGWTKPNLALPLREARSACLLKADLDAAVLAKAALQDACGTKGPLQAMAYLASG